MVLDTEPSLASISCLVVCIASITLDKSAATFFLLMGLTSPLDSSWCQELLGLNTKLWSFCLFCTKDGGTVVDLGGGGGGAFGVEFHRIRLELGVVP